MGLIDDIVLQDDFGDSPFRRFRDQITRIAEGLIRSPEKYGAMLAQKQANREADERRKPLEQYRMEELEEMKKNYWGEDPAYHLARAAFVRKQPRPGTLRCPEALQAACGNEYCDDARNRAANRCAYANSGWSN